MQPLKDKVQVISRYADPSMKRKRDSVDHAEDDSVKERFTHTFFCDGAKHRHVDCELGSEKKRILALVYAVGSPQVFSDLLALYQSHQEKSGVSTNNETQRAMQAYTIAEAQDVRATLRKRAAALHIHLLFQERQKLHKYRLMIAKSARRKNANKKPDALTGRRGLSADSYAVDDLIAEWANQSVVKVQNLPEYDAMKKKLTKVKAEGKVAQDLETACGIPIWTLLPCRKVISPYDNVTEICPKMYDMFSVFCFKADIFRYYALSAADLTTFGNHLKENRPFLFECLPHYTAQLEAICKGAYVQLKPERHSPDSILQLACDSKELLSWLTPL
jgi:hypothetical protein